MHVPLYFPLLSSILSYFENKKYADSETMIETVQFRYASKPNSEISCFYFLIIFFIYIIIFVCAQII